MRSAGISQDAVRNDLERRFPVPHYLGYLDVYHAEEESVETDGEQRDDA